MAKDNTLLGIAAVGLIGIGIWQLTKSKGAPDNAPDAIFKIGDGLHLYANDIYSDVEIVGLSWSSTYNQWQYKLKPIHGAVGSEWPYWYLESQLTEWFQSYITV